MSSRWSRLVVEGGGRRVGEQSCAVCNFEGCVCAEAVGPDVIAQITGPFVWMRALHKLFHYSLLEVYGQ